MATAAILAGCHGNQQATEPEAEAEAVVQEEVVTLVADEAMTAYSKLYAAIDTAGVELTPAQKKEWTSYKKAMQKALDKTMMKTTYVDSLAKNDLKDINDQVKTLFYPFGGPDFFFPGSFFPEADTYYILGLEPTGTIINGLRGKEKLFDEFQVAVGTFYRSGYFITKDMMNDLHATAVDGTAPLFAIQLVSMGYSIESAAYKTISEEGELEDSDSKSKLIEISFFKPEENKRKIIRYYSGDISNAGLEKHPELMMHLRKLDPATTAAMTKSASYLLHGKRFSDVRDYILSNTFAVVQDDTGVPYRIWKAQGNREIQLYGKYLHPLNCFSEGDYQPDLEEAFTKPGVKPLPIKIGYNALCNLLVVRKKAE